MSSAAPPSMPPPIDELVAINRAQGDPYGGRFDIDDALVGLDGTGPLRAKLLTDEGTIDCTLDLRHAPLTVANFVGLARGIRPFVGADGQWHTEPYYRDLRWHRAQENQFVQTGRRGSTDDGGFWLQDEVGYGDSFDRGSVMAMANRGRPHTGSVEFFITTGPMPHLEGSHTIFGHCDGEAVVRAIERRVVRSDEPPRLLDIKIHRESASSR